MAVAVLGTGLLGAGFVEAFRQRGVDVRVWNRTPEKASILAEKGAIVCKTPSEATEGATHVHLVLSDDQAVDIVLSQIDTLRCGPVIDHTTTSPRGALKRTQLAEAEGWIYQHAPVFMNPTNARKATGMMLFSGSSSRFEELKAHLTLMTGKLWYIGERVDQAAAFKLFGNAMIIGLIGLLGDVFALGRQLDFDAKEVMRLFEEFQPGGILQARGPKIANNEFSPASFELTMARKDVRLMLESLGEQPAYVFSGLAEIMDQHIQAGNGALDYGVIAGPRPEEGT